MYKILTNEILEGTNIFIVEKNKKRFCIKVTNDKKEFTNCSLLLKSDDKCKIMMPLQMEIIDDYYLLTFEYYKYGDLLSACPLNYLDSLRVMVQIHSAIAYLHSLDIIHADIKMENVFITDQKDVKLGDFGLSFPVGNEPLGCVGTLECVAPELIVDEIDPESQIIWTKSVDWWSFGVLIYELLFDNNPFKPLNATNLSKKEYHKSLCRNIKINSKSLYIPQNYDNDVQKILTNLLKHNYSERQEFATTKFIKLNCFRQVINNHSPAIHKHLNSIQNKNVKINLQCKNYKFYNKLLKAKLITGGVHEPI